MTLRATPYGYASCSGSARPGCSVWNVTSRTGSRSHIQPTAATSARTTTPAAAAIQTGRRHHHGRRVTAGGNPTAGAAGEVGPAGGDTGLTDPNAAGDTGPTAIDSAGET